MKELSIVVKPSYCSKCDQFTCLPLRERVMKELTRREKINVRRVFICHLGGGVRKNPQGEKTFNYPKCYENLHFLLFHEGP